MNFIQHSSPPPDNTTMPPKGPRQANLRACLVCSLLQTNKDFLDAGCPNCEDVCEVSETPNIN